MKIKIKDYLFIVLIIIFFDAVYAQEYQLKVVSKNAKENTFLNTIDFKRKDKDSTFVLVALTKITNCLKNNGYFTNSIDSVVKNNKKHTAYFSLNEKTDKAIIKIENIAFLPKSLKTENNTFTLQIEKLQATLLSISKKLDSEGKSFSKVQLKNIKLKNKTLFADLEITASKKRTINKVIIKDYKQFSKSFIKHYFNIKKGTVLNQSKINDISNLSKNLTFIKEIKAPEILFTKDSTLLYLYLKKHQNNSFDGLVNFASQENGGVLFNGHIDLKLNNILNTGENFEVFWNSIGNERQEFKLATEIPYIFNSAVTPAISFSIYKQDSTFLNTKFNSKLFYNLSTKTKLAFSYTSENSKNLEEAINNNIETYSNYFLGFQFSYKVPKGDFFYNDAFYFDVTPNIGKRKTEDNNVNQFKIEATASYIWDLNNRNSIFIRNKTGYLNSDTFLDNELFRIGGANSIRGFNEQSIFTNSYTFFNFEYRFLTSQKSYFYSITDLGTIKSTLENKTLLGIGLGYLFTSNNSQINLSTAIGKSTGQNFDFKNSKLIISWKSFF